MMGALLALYHWWQMILCALPLPYTAEVRHAAWWYETARIDSVTEEVTPHLLAEREVERFPGSTAGFAVVGWRLANYSRYADVVREAGEVPDPQRRPGGIDWKTGNFDSVVGDPCWPGEGRFHVRLHIECTRWMERMAECPRTGPHANCADCCDGECCWYWVDPVEMCYRSCWIVGQERLDGRCGPR